MQNQINQTPREIDEIEEMRFENPELEKLRVRAIQLIQKSYGGRK